MRVYLKKQNFFFRTIALKIGILFLVIGALNIFQWQTRTIFYSLTNPLSEALWRAGNAAVKITAPFANIKKIQADVEILRQENQKLVSQVFTLQQFIQRQEDYQNALHNAKSKHISIAPASIIGLDGARDTAVINKGLRDGIHNGMPIITAQNILYGKVIKAYEAFSHVMLISNKASVINVKIVSDDDEKVSSYGAVKGLGNLVFFLDLVDSNAHMKEGQSLVTSGMDGVFPAGLLVGTITAVNTNDLKPFQTAHVKPFVNPRSVENVFALTDYVKNNVSP